MTHHVYYFWRDRTPLYIGVTGDVDRRLRRHKRSPWAKQVTRVSTVAFEDRHEAYAVETEQIQSLRPLYNIRDNPRFQSPIDLYEAHGFVSEHEEALLLKTLNRIFARPEQAAS